MSKPKWNEAEIRTSAAQAARELGYVLKPKQEEAVLAFVGGQDVFVSLPTGFGKTLCFAVLPWTFDQLRGEARKSIVIVVSPLNALMESQVKTYREKGISAAFVHSSAEIGSIEEGLCQLVFFSPESLLCKRRWRELLRSPVYRSNLVGVVIDEAHCVEKW